jgi:hypothetical protein
VSEHGRWPDEWPGQPDRAVNFIGNLGIITLNRRRLQSAAIPNAALEVAGARRYGLPDSQPIAEKSSDNSTAHENPPA